MVTQNDTIANKLRPRLLSATAIVCQGRPMGASAFCDICEGLHHHGGDAEFADGVYAPGCFTGSASPYAKSGYRLDICREATDPRDALPLAPFRGQAWRRLEAHSRRLKAHTAAALFDRKKALSIATLRLKTRPFRGMEFNLAFSLWSVGRVASGVDLLSAATWLFGISPGVVAARLLEASTGASFDAQAFLEITDAVDRWRERGSPRGAGRR